MPIIWTEGMVQQTPAARAVFQSVGRAPARRTSKARKAKGAPRVRRKAKRAQRAAGRSQNLVKGSAAAKRRMAQLRKMRRK